MAFSFNMQYVHKFLIHIVEHWGPHKGRWFSVEKIHHLRIPEALMTGGSESVFL